MLCNVPFCTYAPVPPRFTVSLFIFLSSLYSVTLLFILFSVSFSFTLSLVRTLLIMSVEQCCLLFAVYSLQFTVHSLLFKVYCLLFTVYCLLCIVNSLQFTVYSLLFTVYCLLFTVHCVQFTVYSLQLTVDCLQFTVYSLLFTVYHGSILATIWPLLLSRNHGAAPSNYQDLFQFLSFSESTQ